MWSRDAQVSASPITVPAWQLTLLRGIIAKLERALALRDEIQAVQARLRGDGREQREYDSTANEADRGNRIVWREWRLTKAPDPLPLSFAAPLGDVIQNLRAALD
jgi:hypothetical protein